MSAVFESGPSEPPELGATDGRVLWSLSLRLLILQVGNNSLNDVNRKGELTTSACKQVQAMGGGAKARKVIHKRIRAQYTTDTGRLGRFDVGMRDRFRGAV